MGFEEKIFNAVEDSASAINATENPPVAFSGGIHSYEGVTPFEFFKSLEQGSLSFPQTFSGLSSTQALSDNPLTQPPTDLNLRAIFSGRAIIIGVSLAAIILLGIFLNIISLPSP